MLGHVLVLVRLCEVEEMDGSCKRGSMLVMPTRLESGEKLAEEECYDAGNFWKQRDEQILDIDDQFNVDAQ